MSLDSWPTAQGSDPLSPFFHSFAALARVQALLVCRKPLLFRLSLFDLLFVLFVGQIVVAHPSECHVIYSPLAERDEVFRIGIELVIGAVVVPGNDMQQRPSRKQRLLVFSIEIYEMPGELIITHTAESFDSSASSIDRLHTLRL